MFKKRNVDMFGDEQEYFENRRAEPMNEAFFEEHFDSSASVYGVNENLSDEKKEAKQLKNREKGEKKLKITIKNILYPLTSMGYFFTLVIVEIAVFFAIIELERNVISTPLKYTGEMLLVIAAIVAVVIYIGFVFLSVPILKAKQETKNKVREYLGLDKAEPINAHRPQSQVPDKKDDLKLFFKNNLAWIVPVGLIIVFATGGGVIGVAIIIAIFKNVNKTYHTKHTKTKRK